MYELVSKIESYLSSKFGLKEYKVYINDNFLHIEVNSYNPIFELDLDILINQRNSYQKRIIIGRTDILDIIIEYLTYLRSEKIKIILK